MTPRSRTAGSSRSTDHRQDDPEQVCADCGHFRDEHDGDGCGAMTQSKARPEIRRCECDGFLDA